MADETIVNGVFDDRTVEIGHYEATDSKNISVLMQKVEALEQEKLQLETDKAELTKEMETLGHKATRAVGLETEFSRLKLELIGNQEANAELVELNRVVEEMKEREGEKGLKLETVEKERNLLLQLREEREERENKIDELEERIREREGEIRVLKEKIGDFQGEIGEKEGAIRELNGKIGELEGVVMRTKMDMEKGEKERGELEIVKNELEGLLKKSESRVKEMENKVNLLEEEVQVKKEITVNGVHGKEPMVLDRGVIVDGENGWMNLKVEWPVAASVGAVAVLGAVCYFRYARET
ncbi:unnamed protein product [Ilex paraguariensis]|uniref:Peroxisomal and mitochondrial division factor 2-like n=1 Tax=Ilex paraguariensis TaxID=185542 RepID=A0ABC8QKQ7_9AQUA